MKSTLLVAAGLAVALGAARGQTTESSSLFTRSDWWWAGAFVVGSVAMSTADLHVASAWNDSTRRDMTSVSQTSSLPGRR